MKRAARRAAATLLLALALPLLAGTAALAATPSPTPTFPVSKVIVYSGTGVTTNPTNPAFAAEAAILPTTATVDCTSSPCTIVSIVTDTTSGNVIYDLTDGQRVPLSDGKAAVHIAGHADAGCVDGEVPPGEFQAVAAGETVTVSYAFGGQSDYSCADGSTVQTADGYIYTAVLTATSGSACLVTGTCPTPTPTPEATATALPANASTPLRVSPHGVQLADPSTLSTLPTVANAVTVPNILWAAAATVVLVLLIALPSHLLNSATEAGTDRVSAWWRRRRAQLRPLLTPRGPAKADADLAHAPAAASKPVDITGWPLAAVGVLGASVISSFVDPTFGFNPASIRVFLSILVSFLLDAVAGWFLLILFVRRANPSATARFTFTPTSLLIVVLAVLFTRLTGFAPGIVFGLVAGVAFGAISAAADKARQTLVTLGYSFVLAIVGWVGFSAIADAVGAHPAAPVVFVQETLSSMAIGGIAALPIALIPLRGMAGHVIWNWNPWVWGGGYVIGLLGFFVVLMPKPFSWATVGLSVWTWVGIYLAYAIGSVVIWLLAARPWHRPDDDQPADVHSRDAAAGA